MPGDGKSRAGAILVQGLGFRLLVRGAHKPSLIDLLTGWRWVGRTSGQTNGRTVIPRSGFAWHTRFFRELVWFVVVYLAATDVGGECSASLVAESHIYRYPGPRALGEGEEAHG